MPARDEERWEQNEEGAWTRKLQDPGLAVAEDEDGSVPEGVNATKAAYEYAVEEGVDLSSVTGSGLDGKITKPDVEAAVEARTA